MAVQARDIFTIWTKPDPDMNASDIKRLVDGMVQRQKLMTQFLRGELDASTFLDVVEHFGSDVDEYIEMVCDNVDALVDGEIELEPGSINIGGEYYQVV